MTKKEQELSKEVERLNKMLQYEDTIEDILKRLENLFDDKIKELHDVKGHQTERHAFAYYRSLVWQIMRQLKRITKI